MPAFIKLSGIKERKLIEGKKSTNIKGIIKAYRRSRVARRKEIKLLEIEVQKNLLGLQSAKPNCFTSTTSKIRTF